MFSTDQFIFFNLHLSQRHRNWLKMIVEILHFIELEE